MKAAGSVAWMLAVTAGVIACGASDPQNELERLVDEASAAAEARDTGFFRDLISERYADARGRDREQLVNAIRAYFLSHPQVEVDARIDSLRMSGVDAAELVVLVRASAPRGGSFLAASGEERRVELELVREGGEWSLIGADWARAGDLP